MVAKDLVSCRFVFTKPLNLENLLSPPNKTSQIFIIKLIAVATEIDERIVLLFWVALPEKCHSSLPLRKI